MSRAESHPGTGNWAARPGRPGPRTSRLLSALDPRGLLPRPTSGNFVPGSLSLVYAARNRPETPPLPMCFAVEVETTPNAELQLYEEAARSPKKRKRA